MQRVCWLKFVWIGGGNLNGLNQEMMMMMQMEMRIMMVMMIMVVMKFEWDIFITQFNAKG